MQILQTKIPGLLIIEPNVFEDQRGYFFESYNQERYTEAGLDTRFVQDNISSSVRGVIRGLHYQLAPYSQAKLIQVLKGTVLDVAVDLRQGSPTFGEHYAIELSEKNRRQFFIPSGFAHGFSVLSEEVLFHYKCDRFYNREAERGINFNDSELNIDWQIPEEEAIVSGKDQALPSFKEAERNFIFRH
ncbi:dTDP-4-dehydrorhamnose 3,5-epimerase [Marinilabilia salmonicolor]|jgi:dTDP-4-dehydrorhamnose 3,5-epimerase|uniref:dTDP-4-dehydrorhamnose 3,5-epimerase n=1 Tax=Marinilabilia salmonicolor TaxID=989 RepID=A0A2T0XAR1_9BACT|nr:dTDP-4-dehydrorhamnose 3,5-epimerase [Marinilabilia salmonicolor]PRY96013.1 dTDP-4-dehydrorhamnose 3,5-epimerase [Marinilabilia salmonicolor]RCW29428.1 dTDP-4-dehydrorhamnose 3,5-epimerase [Marinilabilia salmonicolor]